MKKKLYFMYINVLFEVFQANLLLINFPLLHFARLLRRFLAFKSFLNRQL